MVQSTLRCHRCDAPDAAVVKSSAICTMALAWAGYVVADNYFELYVNGKLVGVDPVPFTPFNSIIVRFRVQETLHVRAESGGLGGEARLGMETNRGNRGYTGSSGDGTDSERPQRARYAVLAVSCSQLFERRLAANRTLSRGTLGD